MNVIQLHPIETEEVEEMEYTPMNYIMALLNPDYPPVVDGREMTDHEIVEYLRQCVY
ncbi:hypothetical protein [Lactobacillus delbrueckii]|uniref:hypothetical protein n=1 Tax=Lactobacillus delbrueckii TaxID=1584 RepID=UPI001F289523|nr:hypothetical protein [Lactobacillus delbrueckii]GHN50839.1 hypothetical protein ME801_05080 [Lactobacillus delbrueckii]